jgi:hypothetical protein
MGLEEVLTAARAQRPLQPHTPDSTCLQMAMQHSAMLTFGSTCRLMLRQQPPVVGTTT